MTVLLLAGLLGLAGGSDLRQDWESVQDSLRQMHPRFRASWLRDHGLDQQTGSQSLPSDSGPLRIVGRWSFGPAFDVDCRITPTETLVALARGSGVSLLRFSRGDTAEFELLANVNAERILNQVMIRDSLLYVGTNAGLETYDISDERNPVRLSWIRTALAGFDVKDSLAFVTWYDSFKVYSMANPASPYRVGWCRDSGASVTVAGNTAFLGDGSGLHAIDITNPAAPHRVGSWGTSIMSAKARGNICCVTQYDPDSLRFFVLDVSNPASMHPLSTLYGAGGDALCISGQYVFTAGAYGFQMLDISDSLNARIAGSCGLGNYKFGVWGRTGFDRAFVANEAEGLAVIDNSSPTQPAPDTFVLAAGYTVDLDLRGHLLYVANELGGLKILDVSDPTLPAMIGELDTVNAQEWSTSVAVGDSFAFMGWFNTPLFRTVSVADPTRPAFAGSCDPFEEAQDMVLRDSFVYCAENYRFQVVDVARPRQPRVVGTLNLPEHSNGMVLSDTLAYIATYPLEIISIANPGSPRIIGSISRGAWNIDVQETLAFAAGGRGLFTYSVANPAAPYEIDSLGLGSNTFDVGVVDTLAFVSTRTDLCLVSVADVRNPIVRGRHPLPGTGWRVELSEPYIYVATQDAGVCIFETTATGIAEHKPSLLDGALRLVVRPSPASRWLYLALPGVAAGFISVATFDASGRCVSACRTETAGSGLPVHLDVGNLVPGLYFMRAEVGGARYAAKLVKQ